MWFDGQAEDAVSFCLSVFPKAKVLRVVRHGKAGPGPEGSVLTVSFELNGQEFLALNGGPQFKFNEAVSFVVNCETQEEVDRYWDVLTRDGGAPGPCGWLKDRYGLSWQVVPAKLEQWMSDPDPEKANRVMEAVLQMSKLDVTALERAYSGR